MKNDLIKLARKHGTPLFILDHDKIRENFRTFKKNLPTVQAYYAVKANSNQEIIKTLFGEGASFDVASYNEFMQIHEQLESFRKKDKDFFVWDKIIFSNTIKDKDTLRKIKKYKPLMTYDNADEIKKIKKHSKNIQCSALVWKYRDCLEKTQDWKDWNVDFVTPMFYHKV
jgi:ornithine decarboxylase